eukprot:TRINITY_DN16129_c0_g1_i1.p1 TRINITY_DN16129_c0_g1~~TRINITY_DN16129_c0_g1_i1.p1  ORF type:complete len:289 (+),score=47.19 TRINITY_DN16129_c0_g1_i1:48-914(+)
MRDEVRVDLTSVVPVEGSTAVNSEGALTVSATIERDGEGGLGCKWSGCTLVEVLPDSLAYKQGMLKHVGKTVLSVNGKSVSNSQEINSECEAGRVTFGFRDVDGADAASSTPSEVVDKPPKSYRTIVEGVFCAFGIVLCALCLVLPWLTISSLTFTLKDLDTLSGEFSVTKLTASIIIILLRVTLSLYVTGLAAIIVTYFIRTPPLTNLILQTLLLVSCLATLITSIVFAASFYREWSSRAPSSYPSSSCSVNSGLITAYAMSVLSMVTTAIHWCCLRESVPVTPVNH